MLQLEPFRFLGVRMSTGFELVLWALLIAATITDLVWGKIFNILTLPFLVGGVVTRFLAVGPSSAGTGLLAVLVAFIAFFPLYALKTWAAADVKLLMAIGAWTDFKFVLQLGFVSIFVGALVGLFILLKKKGLRQGTESVVKHMQSTPGKKSLKIPFAPAFLCAFCLLQIAEMKGWNLVPF